MRVRRRMLTVLKFGLAVGVLSSVWLFVPEQQGGGGYTEAALDVVGKYVDLSLLGLAKSSQRHIRDLPRDELRREKSKEDARLAERKKKEEARLAEEQRRKEEEDKKAEQEKREEDSRLAEERRKEEEAKVKEQKRKQEEAQIAEQKRKDEEARIAEQKRKDEVRIAELKRKAEEARIAEQEKQEEEARVMEEKRKEEARVAEVKRKEEEARVAEVRKEEEARVAEEKRKEEEARIAEAKRKGEEARIAEAKSKEEEARVAEEKRKEEKARIAEEKRKEEEARVAEEKIRKEAARIAEAKRKEEEARVAEEKRKGEEAKVAEEKRKAEEAKLKEQKRKEAEAKVADKTRKEETRAKEEQKKEEETRIVEQERKEDNAKVTRQKKAEEDKLADEKRKQEQKKKTDQERLDNKKSEEQKKREAAVQQAKLNAEKALQKQKEEQAKVQEEYRQEQLRRIANVKNVNEEKKADDARRQDEYEKAQAEVEHFSENQAAGSSEGAKTDVHLAVVACGDRMPETVILLKSARMLSRVHLHFHVFAEEELKPKFRAALEAWPEDIKKQTTFDIQSLAFPPENAAEWKKLFKTCASQRLFLPDLLPKLDAVLYLDTDILFMRPPEDIWHFFHRFNSSQIAALAPEHEDAHVGWYNRFARHPFYPPLGVNSGVMLMNLTRMRQVKWVAAMIPYHKEYKYRITWGDQDLINIYFHFKPEMLYVYPCHWNFRPDHCMYMSICKQANEKGANLVHGNRRVWFEDKQPAFKALYQTFEVHKFEDGLSKLLTRLNTNMTTPGVKNTNCGKVSEAMIGQLKRQIGLITKPKKETSTKNKAGKKR